MSERLRVRQIRNANVSSAFRGKPVKRTLKSIFHLSCRLLPPEASNIRCFMKAKDGDGLREEYPAAVCRAPCNIAARRDRFAPQALRCQVPIGLSAKRRPEILVKDTDRRRLLGHGSRSMPRAHGHLIPACPDVSGE